MQKEFPGLIDRLTVRNGTGFVEYLREVGLTRPPTVSTWVRDPVYCGLYCK
jgi:hypothetical protein